MRSAESKLKIRQGILNGRRVDFFKGKHAANALLRDPYKKSPMRPAIPDREAAEKLLSELLTLGFFVRVEKESKSKVLSLQQLQVFGPEAFYVWVYEGSQWRGTLIGLGVLMLTLAGVMFPALARLHAFGVYYLSLAVLGLMGCWLFPNLFADVGIVESFIPTWRYSQ
ncbi:hypothetical protein BC829DRAFT_425933 [Chytridium lagenaria]|nr:hypothetical protein BC829DRAFT_425933 [Chytridium lagenaria]